VEQEQEAAVKELATAAKEKGISQKSSSRRKQQRAAGGAVATGSGRGKSGLTRKRMTRWAGSKCTAWLLGSPALQQCQFGRIV